MLGKTSEYAIRALVYVYIQNIEGKRPGFKEIAKNIDSPEQFTGKVLQNLTREKLVSSMKGRGGGFFFDHPAIPLPIYDVVRAVEGDDFFSKCGFGLKLCNCKNPCPIHDDYAPLRDGFFKLIKNQTIQSLAIKINEHKAVLKR